MALFRGNRTFTLLSKCIDATKRSFFNGAKYNLYFKKHISKLSYLLNYTYLILLFLIFLSFFFLLDSQSSLVKHHLSSIYSKPLPCSFKQNLYSTTSGIYNNYIIFILLIINEL